MFLYFSVGLAIEQTFDKIRSGLLEQYYNFIVFFWIFLLTITINCDNILNVKRLTNTKKYFKKSFHKVLTITIHCDKIKKIKQGQVIHWKQSNNQIRNKAIPTEKNGNSKRQESTRKSISILYSSTSALFPQGQNNQYINFRYCFHS